MIPGFPNIALPALFFLEGWGAASLALKFGPSWLTSALLAHGVNPLWPAAAIGAVLCITQSIALKRKLLTPHEIAEAMVPTEPERHPGIEIGALHLISGQLAALGFESQIDYTVVRTPPNGVEGFARLLYHPRAHVFAEVNQVTVRNKPATRMAMTLFSLFDDAWSFSTMTKSPSRHTAIVYALRRPRRLWQILAGVTPATAFERHVAAAALLAARLQRKPVAGDPVDAYLAS